MSYPKSAQVVEIESFKQFEREGWEISAAAYDQSFGALTMQMIQPLMAELRPAQACRFLDIATGPGYVAAEALKRGYTVTAMDISEAMIARARKNLTGPVDVRVGDAEALPFEASAFDVVAMNFGILHLAQPERAALQAYKVLQSGGCFGFSVWAERELSPGFGIVLDAIESYGSPSVQLPVGPPFFKYASEKEGIGLLTKTGFSSPRMRLINLKWQLPNPESLFEAFYRGTARTGGNLRAQPVENRERIRRAVVEVAAKFQKEGLVQIPMAARVYVGVKSEPPLR